MPTSDPGRASVAVKADDCIVVVADSHSKIHPRALDWIAGHRPTAILHAGDIGSLDVIDSLETVAPTYAVRGNVDGRDPRTPDDRIIEVERHGALALRILLTHIAVYGPRLNKAARERARAHRAQLVICGHSHVPLIAQEGDIAVFNPGSLGPRRFQLPITFGVLGFSENGLRLRHIDCESGEHWLPPGRP